MKTTHHTEKLTSGYFFHPVTITMEDSPKSTPAGVVNCVRYQKEMEPKGSISSHSTEKPGKYWEELSTSTSTSGTTAHRANDFNIPPAVNSKVSTSHLL